MRTLNTRFQRLLRLRDVEFFQVMLSDDERSAYLLIHDERESEDLEKGNHISVCLISHFELSDISYQDILSFNDDLLGMKYNCSYEMNTLSVKEDFSFNFPFDMVAIRNHVQELLSLLKIDKKLPDLEELSFNYLSQD